MKPTAEQLNNRFCYHSPKSGQQERYEQVRYQVRQLALICVSITPDCEEQKDALKALDQAMFLFNAAIARNEV